MKPLDLELQLGLHAGALRALARDLVRNEHAAEDAVQEAVLTTLRQPPPRPGTLGGWLATLVRNLCFQHRRREQRRQQREQLASRAEALPAAADLAARREILRRVTDAVLALREPYQSVVLLRWFEGLPPRKIAARTGTNLATVKSRLQRGLQLLRAELDRGHRDRSEWQHGLLALLGGNLLAPGKAALVAAGITLMGPVAKLSLIAAAVVASTALVWSLTATGPAEPPPVAALREDGPTAAPATTQPQAREALAARTNDSHPAAQVPSDLDHPYPFELEVLVLDKNGLPVADTAVQVAPLQCTLSAWNQRTGADGVTRIAFRGRQSAVDLVLATDGQRAALRAAVQSGVPTRLVLGGTAPEAVAVRGTRVRGLNLTFSGSSASFGEIVVDGSALRTVTADSDNLHPFARFTDQASGGLRREETVLSAGSFRINRGTFAISLGGVSVDTTSQPAATARLEGVVYGEDGKPVPRCTVTWGVEEDRPLGRTQTDDQGAFKFERVRVGTLHLRAGGGDGGLCRGRATTSPEQLFQWSPRLARGTTLAGSAVDQDGKPLAGWTVEFVGDAQAYFDECTVRDDGTFELPNHPGGMGSLLLWSKDRRQERLPMLVSRSVRPDNGPVQLRLDRREAAGRIELEAALPATATESPMLRAWQEDTGRGVSFNPVAEHRYAIGSLPAGWYRLEFHAGCMGWVDAGRHWVDGHSTLQLGRVAIPAPGALRIAGTVATAATAGSQPAVTAPEQQICVHRADCDLRITSAPGATPDLQYLPAGDYWYLWRDAAGVVHHRPFTLRAGLETVIERP